MSHDLVIWDTNVYVHHGHGQLRRQRLFSAVVLQELRFSEILGRGSSGRIEWRIDQDPELIQAAAAWRRYEGRQRGAWRKLTRMTSDEPSSRTGSQLL